VRGERNQVSSADSAKKRDPGTIAKIASGFIPSPVACNDELIKIRTAQAIRKSKRDGEL
jgi:hypothetical protein